MVKQSKYREVLPPELLAQEIKNKLTLSDISRKYKLGYKTVKTWAEKNGHDVETLTDRMKLRPTELFIALERFDLSFTKDEVKDIKELWSAGINIVDMARKMKRDEVEIAVLIMDLAASNRIQPRKNGVFGEVG